MEFPRFLSDSPRVTLVNIFERPYENAVATARTCYSANGIVRPEEVSLKPELRDRIAASTYEAGHHTTLQHGHVQFALENVSRQFIWSFLHAHPFYNSEQVSQRYVRVAGDQVVIPPLSGPALAVYEETVACQMAAYTRLIELLTPVVEHFYYGIFPLRRGTAKNGGRPHALARRTIPKRAQEIARYVLPVGTFAYLYHTVSVITLLRYYRLCQQFDAPAETRMVVELMMQAVLDADPLLEKIIQEPLPLEETVEYRFWEERGELWGTRQKSQIPNPKSQERGTQGNWGELGGTQEAFRREFDEGLNGHTSRLVSWKADNEGVLAQAVREVLGLPVAAMSDREAIGLVLDPRQNGYFGEAMNVTTMSKLARALHHPSYTFRKKLSHTADSQDQRHRMTPASRPMLTAYLTGEPDYITPELICHEPAAQRLYEETMARTWEGIGRLRGLGVAEEYVAYLLPNAVSIRFTESSDLMALHHKLRMRLCYNAQEEIFKASRDEALQIQAVNPEIGRYLGAPCTLRYAANSRPFCPEGDRYCGVPVWKLEIGEYERVI